MMPMMSPSSTAAEMIIIHIPLPGRPFDRRDGLLMSGPEVVSRGFVYVKESEALLDEVRLYAANTLTELLDRGVKDFNQLKTTLKDELSRMLYKRTGRRPMVLPILLDL